MEFRKILYLKNKDINVNNCIILKEARPHLKLSKPETLMVLRILVNDKNIVVIEFAKPISLESIQEATKLDELSENQENNSQQPLKPEMDKSYGVEKNEFSSRDTGELRSSGVEDHLPNSHSSPADTIQSESSEVKK